MTNAELTLDQLQAISGGFGAKMNRMVSTNDEAGLTSIECKVPAPDKKPHDGYAVVRERERLIGIA